MLSFYIHKNVNYVVHILYICNISKSIEW